MDFLTKILNGRFKHFIFISLMFLILVTLFFKIAFLNYVPKASDTLQWRSAAECMISYNKHNSEQAIWNSNVFAGMPGYLISFGSKYPFINTILKFSNKLINWRILLLFSAAVGIYLLMIFLKFEPIIAFTVAIAFALSTHLLGLLEIGHNSKFKAIIYLPWIFLAIHYLKERKSILATGFLALMLIGQLRENHAQISYYTFILIGIYWAFQLIWSIKDKKIKSHIIFSLMLLFTIVVALIAIAQPYLSTYEYGEYTIRGGTEGVGKEYATSWSFHPAEILTFLIPNFFGGTSPDYWGWMPFTQTSMYFGITIFTLAFIALIFCKKRFIKLLMTVSIVALLISFGRHFSPLSNLLLNYLPFFNKFRVPTMILILLQFSAVILAGFGLKTIVTKNNDENFKKNMKIAFYLILILGFLFIISTAILQKMQYTNATEIAKIKQQLVSEYGRVDGLKYASNYLKTLKTKRHNLLLKDGYFSFGLLILLFGTIFLFNKNKLAKYPFLMLISLFIIVDLVNVDKRFLQNIEPQKTIDKTYQKTDADKFLLSDDEDFRIYPLGGNFGQNQWSYYHQSIGGYHAVKLQRYQDIIENCLHFELKNRVPINWNVVNMLNVKYIVFGQKLPLENLRFSFYDRNSKLSIYENLEKLPRAWFVKNIEIIKDKKDIWKRLNQTEFKPVETAIVEVEIGNVKISQNTKVKLLKFDIHNLKFKVETDEIAFLTVSEIYYPAGWEAFIDGVKTEIYATNYILRGVVIPEGEHILEMKFAPKSYKLSLILSLTGILITLLILVIGSIIYYKKNYQGKIDYVIE